MTFHASAALGVLPARPPDDDGLPGAGRAARPIEFGPRLEWRQ